MGGRGARRANMDSHRGHLAPDSGYRIVKKDEPVLQLETNRNRDIASREATVGNKMPLSQEQRTDSNFSNNNDQNYLHKKFKKVALTARSTCNSTEFAEYKSENVDLNKISTENSHVNSDTTKCRIDRYHSLWSGVVENVQSNLNNVDSRLSDVNSSDQSSGRTRTTEEFSNKTETEVTRDVYGSAGGRYVCPYCKLSCAKPSVLQKHIRAHTNERPFPCVPCGFAFKTKSNLYKHRRSRTHALRLQGSDDQPNEEDLSPESESDTSLPATSVSDAGSESSLRLDFARPADLSEPELLNDRATPPGSLGDQYKYKSIYKPKFRAALYQETEDKDKLKKTFSPNSLNEHISKIISENEAIVDVIDTPLQKKYGKIKQIAENHLVENTEVKNDHGPLNLTKSNNEPEKSFRKRSHSESFSQIDFNKHPLNPEGSIIKDLLLKTKANGIPFVNFETPDGQTLYICPLCQITYRSADNLEIHRLYYCKGNASNNAVKKETKPNNIYVRSNSVSATLPDTQSSTKLMTVPLPSPPTKLKPDNLIITKTETNEIIAPLPSPGPLLGNTRLVDSRMPSEYSKNNFKPTLSPKRRFESRSDSYSPRLESLSSPMSHDTFTYSKIRCLELKTNPLRSMEDLTQLNSRQNPKSLHMFGGEVKIVDQSGGTTTLRIEPSKNELSPIIIQQSLSPSKFINDPEASNIVVRSGLHSGGTIMHNSLTPKEVQTQQGQRISASNTPTPNSTIVNIHDLPRFQFPPLSAITAYNPLTLPPLSPSPSPDGTSTILHAGKLIPHVPGMPGPVTPAVYVGNVHQKDSKLPHKNPVYKHDVSQLNKSISRIDTENISTNLNSNKNISLSMIRIKHAEVSSTKPTILINDRACSMKQETAFKRNVESALRSPVAKDTPYLSSKMRTIDKISSAIISKNTGFKTPENEVRNFNFESLITKAEIYSSNVASSSKGQDISSVSVTSTSQSSVERSETSYFQKTQNVKSEEKKPKFLRPTTLPLKPGTFTPKRHHGITPNANTMPLVSPETPRPAKAYGQLYLNGNAYTYLGLKCSTKVFYCTINRPQPTYVPNQRFLSMYSNWQLLSDLPPDPLGLSTPSAMSLYDSRHRPQNIVVAAMRQDMILTHSSQWNHNSNECKQMITKLEVQKMDESKQNTAEVSVGPKKEVTGGFESNEEYTYIRGRGRGRYVCSECGIRCKKPSMLKKHIRTHTDVRPFTCVHCSFSFKTKGNLTKHMKSKAHYKKCCELGINPEEGVDTETSDMAQCSGETDDESDSDGDEGNEGETESSDTEGYKSRLPEHEAAHCLLSLGGARPANNPGLITSARPSTYPYTPVGKDSMQDYPASNASHDSSHSDAENEPMDLSKNEVKTPTNLTEIPTARESSVLASLASNTAKLPQQNTEWTNGEPMLHAYLTERALLDTKIKLSQLSNQNRIKKPEHDEPTIFSDEKKSQVIVTFSTLPVTPTVNTISASPVNIIENNENLALGQDKSTIANAVPRETLTNTVDSKKYRSEGNSENAKFVVSEYLKQAIGNVSNEDDTLEKCEIKNSLNNDARDDMADNDIGSHEHEPVARKVVIGAGGVAFKIGKGKDFDNSFSSGRLMEDGRRVCDFCNKTFTKPSQLRLHLNIHYMERPYRCTACAVSFRTRGHLQKHERSGSHHNKVSMTSTFGAATSLNPRPFKCSDCNVAFRIHGHLAKHLRSKMHVMRLECLFKLPFGTFTEIERAGVSLTDIDTTDCASSLTSLQTLAKRLHEKDPSKLEYREPNSEPVIDGMKESSDDEDGIIERTRECEIDSEIRTADSVECHNAEVIFSATE